MARLFTALWLPTPVSAELSGALGRGSGWPPEGWRPVPIRRWHLTLCFRGEADPGVLARRLDARLAHDPHGGIPAPKLRLAGAVSFARVIAAGVGTAGPEDGRALAGLVSAAGGDPVVHRPHVTVARTARRGDRPAPGGPLHRFTGSWWWPEAVCLVCSEQVAGAPRYTTLHRIPLSPAEPAHGTAHERAERRRGRA